MKVRQIYPKISVTSNTMRYLRKKCVSDAFQIDGNGTKFGQLTNEMRSDTLAHKHKNYTHLPIFTYKHSHYVSHLHQRKEKNCLNCGTEPIDRYCHRCGQENVEPKESLWHLTVHFFNDFTHFDGKFFSTMKLLLTQPGFLSEEYMKGRRAAYLNPIRMYLFISFAFFLLQFSLPSGDGPDVSIKKPAQNAGTVIATKPADTLAKGVYTTESELTIDENFWLNEVAETYPNVAAYDSAQRVLPAEQKHSWSQRFFSRRTIALVQYAEDHPDTWQADYMEILKHSIPKMLFVSIPIFALLLFLLQIRRRRQYYFVSHGIFSIHLYCTIFFLLIVLLPLDYLPLSEWYYSLAVLVIPAIYLFLGMKRFYQQGYFKTFLKFLLLLGSSFLVFVVLMIIFFINALLVLTNGVH